MRSIVRNTDSTRKTPYNISYNCSNVCHCITISQSYDNITRHVTENYKKFYTLQSLQLFLLTYHSQNVNKLWRYKIIKVSNVFILFWSLTTFLVLILVECLVMSMFHFWKTIYLYRRNGLEYSVASVCSILFFNLYRIFFMWFLIGT